MKRTQARALWIGSVWLALGAGACADGDAAQAEIGMTGGAGGAAMATGGAGAAGTLAGAAGTTAGAGGSAGAAGATDAGASDAASTAGTGGADAPDGGAADAEPPASDAGETPDASSTDGLFDDTCSPQITVVNDDPSGDGASFVQAVPDPEALLTEITRTVCEILYRAPDEPRMPESLTLRVYSFDGVANAGGETINLSTRHLDNYSGPALLEEITGVLVHETTHLYQYNDGPGGLIEGIADYVRIEAGHHSYDRRQPGGNWDDGYTTTGFFVSWLDEHYPEFGYRLNLALTRDDNQGWSEQVFEDLTGKDVATLWQEYQDDL